MNEILVAERMMSIAQKGRNIRSRKRYEDFVRGKLNINRTPKTIVIGQRKIVVSLTGTKRCTFGQHDPLKREFAPHAGTPDGLRKNCRNCERYKRGMENLDFTNKFKNL